MGVTPRRLAGVANLLKDQTPATFGSNLASIALRDGGGWDLP